MLDNKMRYIVQADYENGETLFIAENGDPPTLSIDNAQIFLSEQEAERIAKEKNDSIPDLVWEVAEY
jgi:hypothetical protein